MNTAYLTIYVALYPCLWDPAWYALAGAGPRAARQPPGRVCLLAKNGNQRWQSFPTAGEKVALREEAREAQRENRRFSCPARGPGRSRPLGPHMLEGTMKKSHELTFSSTVQCDHRMY